ncbi:hypothetical protein [Merismopedia glauca]|uniref:Peptidase S1 n=1 Tax=Merismopedia glauca CCAP 1448/3 TaxID=1296344 RepID=A0A2T1C159_9CYAN|nr:hypothetical protein [Merismopedia glauca]PSB02006.1 hypothetical protein C7B64_15270 [Merismopedia glauca CCAP 1448/3]
MDFNFKTKLAAVIVPSILTLALSYPHVAWSQSQNIEIKPGFASDPIELRGTSGGTQSTPDCGKIAKTPNHIINMSQDFPYLRLSVRSSGNPTLLIVEPGGRRSCILADSFSQGSIQSSGYWKKGPYEISVGDRSGTSHNYTLSITQRSK